MRSRICGNCMGSGKELRFEEVGRDGVCVTVKTEEVTCHKCNGSGQAPMTNADRIRSMSDEELAEYLAQLGSDTNNGVIFSDRDYEWLEYLQMPWEEE